MQKNGFSLVEMSIIVVIIGLIIGGIITGQSLLRNYRVNSVIAESAGYVQAINNFRDKYQALPGDITNAQTLWGADTGCPTTVKTTARIETCNGDGDGFITVNISGTRLDEQFRAWQHLANAEMIKGRFTGTTSSLGNRDRIVDTNIPKSQLNKAGWGIISITLTDIASGYNIIPYTAPDIAPNHVLWLGARSINATDDYQTPVLSPPEALSIDQKTDDGLPGSGKVIAQANGTNGTCSNSATAYNISSSNILCSIVFKTGF